jgi:hypothetical protein
VLPFALFLLLVTANALPAGERYATENFVVDAPNRELAKTFGEYAETYRREKALDWLGYEMPRWPQKCPLKVQITMNQTGGATTFTFGPTSNGRMGVQSQEMKIFGETNQLLKSVLPHEVTHTVLAHHFGQAVPRWADEGGSVLSENDEERFNHDIRCREILNQGRGIPLRALFQMTEYPRDMIVVYAQGYSICQYLIDKGGADGKQKFLQFVGTGMRNGNRNWEEAVRMYGYENTDELQESWIEALRTPPQRIAARNEQQRSRPTAPAATLASTGRGTETRSSAVTSLPLLEPPVVARGTSPDRDDRPTAMAASRSKPTTVEATPRPPVIQLGPPEPPTRR